MSAPSDVEQRDPEGFAPIARYGVLGDGRGVALAVGDGAVDWWAIPRLDFPPAVCRAARLRPRRPFRAASGRAATAVERRYLPDTAVLESTWTTETGRVRVREALNSGTSGELPWSELARRVDGIDGRVEVELIVAPGNSLGAWEPGAEDDPRGPVLHAGDITLGLRCTPTSPSRWTRPG